MSAILTGATIQEASLAITVTSRTATTWLKLELYPVLRSWLENQATWNVAQSGVNWTLASCNGVGSDRAANAVATVTVDTAAGKVTLPGLAGLVQSWVNNPGGNVGLLLRPQANTGGATLTYTFASSQYWTEGDRPALTVKYTTGAALAATEAEVKAEVEAEPQAPAAAVVTKYYYLGNARVAMRQGSTLYYLLGDHLGSTSATYNPATQAVAQQWYKPYGESRWSSGTLPTDRKFTGQREEATLGSLYDFQARFYSPYLNRWIQPDTIVPDPANPQSLNRYSYAANNPVKYRDPSGHIPCYGDGPDECSWAGYKDQPAGARRHSLRGYARFLEKQVQKDGMTALDDMVDLWGFAGLYGKDAVTTSDDVSYTLVGSGGTLTLLGGFLLKGQEFLGGAPLNLPNFGDTGFNRNYQDFHNQPYHFWANVNTTAQGGNLGQGIGLAANVIHEMADPTEALKTPQERGTSWEDYFLSLKGMEMGQMLHSGALTVDQAGSWMQANLSAPAGPAYDFWKSTGTGWWPSVWMQHAVDLFR